MNQIEEEEKYIVRSKPLSASFEYGSSRGGSESLMPTTLRNRVQKFDESQSGKLGLAANQEIEKIKKKKRRRYSHDSEYTPPVDDSESESENSGDSDSKNDSESGSDDIEQNSCAPKENLHYFDKGYIKFCYFSIGECRSHEYDYIPESLPFGFASLMLDETVYLVGGYIKQAADNEYKNIVAFQPKKKEKFKIHGSLKYERRGHSIVYVNHESKGGLIIIVGCVFTHAARRMETYNIATKSVSADEEELKEPRHLLSLCNVEDKYIYAIGGKHSDTYKVLNSIERIKISHKKEKWEFLQFRKEEWVGKFMFSSACINDTILMFGGNYGMDESISFYKWQKKQFTDSVIVDANKQPITQKEEFCSPAIVHLKNLLMVNQATGKVAIFKIITENMFNKQIIAFSKLNQDFNRII